MREWQVLDKYTQRIVCESLRRKKMSLCVNCVNVGETAKPSRERSQMNKQLSPFLCHPSVVCFLITISLSMVDSMDSVYCTVCATVYCVSKMMEISFLAMIIWCSGNHNDTMMIRPQRGRVRAVRDRLMLMMLTFLSVNSWWWCLRKRWNFSLLSRLYYRRHKLNVVGLFI